MTPKIPKSKTLKTTPKLEIVIGEISDLLSYCENSGGVIAFTVDRKKMYRLESIGLLDDRPLTVEKKKV